MKNYIEIAMELKCMILKGYFLPSEKLPSIRSLAIQYNRSASTISSAIKVLYEENLIKVNSTKGYYVTNDSEYIRMKHKQMVQDITQNYINKMMSIGLSAEEIIVRINQSKDF